MQKGKKMKNIIVMIILSSITLFAGNPGVSAMNCINASINSNNKVTLKNSCNYKVFVLWCGEQKFSKKTCGEGGNNSFYTHSRNLNPGRGVTISLKANANYKYAACQGGIGFGSKGIVHNNSDHGRFSCTKLGSYSKNNTQNKTTKTSKNSKNRSNNSKKTSASGVWVVNIGGQKMKLTLNRSGNGSYYAYSNRKTYPLRWNSNGNNINVRAYGTQVHYKRDEPALTLKLTMEGTRISGMQKNLGSGFSSFTVNGRKQ